MAILEFSRPPGRGPANRPKKRHEPIQRATAVAFRALRLARHGQRWLRGWFRNLRKLRAFALLVSSVIAVLLLVYSASTLKKQLGKKPKPKSYISMPKTLSEMERVNDRGAGMMAMAGDYSSVAKALRAPGPPESKDEARIAYFIQIGADSIALLPRLFSRIHHRDNVYVLHVDSKVDAEKIESVHHLVERNPYYRANMHFMPSEMLTYKGISMVFNTIGAMTLAYQKDATWDYFINLSGADYPLVSATDQRRLLARPAVSPGLLNFISLFPKKEWRPYGFRVKYQYWDSAIVGRQDPKARLRRMKMMREHPLEPHRRYEFVKAEAWTILSRPFCQFIIRSSFAKRMLLAHLHVLSAPEHYFADVLYNHPLWSKTIVSDAFRRVVWYQGRKRSGQHPFVLDKGSTMYTFWDELRHSQCLFARKFSVPDSELLDRVDDELSGFDRQNPNSNVSIRERSKESSKFYKELVTHFDYVTHRTLMQQGIEIPSYAYPNVVELDAPRARALV